MLMQSNAAGGEVSESAGVTPALSPPMVVDYSAASKLRSHPLKTRLFSYVAVAAGSMIVCAVLLAQAPPVPPLQPGQPADDPAKVVLSVGENKMTAGYFNDFVAQLPPEVQMMAKGPQKRRVAEDLVKLKLLAGE